MRALWCVCMVLGCRDAVKGDGLEIPSTDPDQIDTVDTTEDTVEPNPADTVEPVDTVLDTDPPPDSDPPRDTAVDCTDPDGDGYGLFGESCGVDNCVGVSNPTQLDSDGDGFGDACDLCETTSWLLAPGHYLRGPVVALSGDSLVGLGAPSPVQEPRLDRSGLRELATTPAGVWYALDGSGLVSIAPCSGDVTDVASVRDPGGVVVVDGMAILADGSAWVAFEQQVGRLDLGTGLVSHAVADRAYVELLARGDGLWGVEDCGDDCTRLVAVDTLGGSTVQAELPRDLHGLAVDPAGVVRGQDGAGVVYAYDASWSERSLGQVPAIDDLVAGSVQCARSLHGVFDRALYWLDPDTGAARSGGVTLAEDVGELSHAPGDLWYGLQGRVTTPTLVTLDLCTGGVTPVGPVALPSGRAVGTAEGLTVLSNGDGYVAVSNDGADSSSETLGQLDLSTGGMLSRRLVRGTVQAECDGLNHDGVQLYCNDSAPPDTTDLGTIDLGSGAFTRALRIPRHVNHFTMGGGRAWAYNYAGGRLDGQLLDVDVVAGTESAVGPVDAVNPGVGTPSDLFWIP